MRVLKGFGVWLKGLPGQVGYFVAVPLVLVGLAILAGFVVHSHVPVWALLAALAVGLVAGAGLVHILSQEDRSALDELAELQKEAAELQPYPTYANHLRDALDLLRKVAMGELPSFSLRDFVEAGVFQPAHVLLTKGATRGDVRFSILHVDGDKFYMSKGGELLPALGHRPQSREEFSLSIAGSFSQLAYERNKVFWSGHLSDDDRFERHDHAEVGREYESIVSVPLLVQGDHPDGVLNAIATSADAFSEVDRTYITLLGSVIDVGRAITALVYYNQQQEEQEQDQEQRQQERHNEPHSEEDAV